MRNVFWAFKKRKRQTWRIPEVQTRARTASPFQSSRWREGSGASLFRTEKNRVVKTAYSCLCRTGLWLPIKPEPEKVWSKWNLIIKGVERKILLSNGPKRTTWLIVETEISLTTISKILQDNNGLQFFYSIRANEACFASYFYRKIWVLHLLEGPELTRHHWEDGEEKKAQHLAGFEPTASLLHGVRSTAVPQLLPHNHPNSPGGASACQDQAACPSAAPPESKRSTEIKEEKQK